MIWETLFKLVSARLEQFQKIYIMLIYKTVFKWEFQTQYCIANLSYRTTLYRTISFNLIHSANSPMHASTLVRFWPSSSVEKPFKVQTHWLIYSKGHQQWQRVLQHRLQKVCLFGATEIGLRDPIRNPEISDSDIRCQSYKKLLPPSFSSLTLSTINLELSHFQAFTQVHSHIYHL